MSNTDTMTHVSGPIIIENGKILLNREKEADGIGEEIWMLPGGGVEAGETYKETCIREVKEELGIDVEIVEKLISYEVEHVTKPGIFLMLHVYFCKRLTEINPGPETLEWGWFDIDHLPDTIAQNMGPIWDLLRKRNLI